MVRSMDLSFDAFVHENVDDLVRMAYVITWDESESEDLVQECLLRVAKHWPRVSAMESPLAYTRRVLVNLALDDRLRRVRRAGELGLTVNPPIDVRAAAALENVEVRAELVESAGGYPAGSERCSPCGISWICLKRRLLRSLAAAPER